MMAINKLMMLSKLVNMINLLVNHGELMVHGDSWLVHRVNHCTVDDDGR